MSGTSRLPPARPMTRSITALTLRRSTRLSGVQVHDHTTAPQQLTTRKTNRRVSKIIKNTKQSRQFKHGGTRSDCTGTQNARKPNSIGRSLSPGPRSASGVSDNVSAREAELILKEKELRLKTRKLEQQLVTASHKEREAAKLLEEYKERLARTTIRQLEDYFTCPLCFEIMACPYSLNPRQCGHTFCATCILKWFFSRLHRVCGSWHEPVDCPMCRSALFYTPDNVPRPESSFPFTPNRAADNAIRGMINSLANEAHSGNDSASSSLPDWGEDGHAKKEWCRKERVGRHEMTSLATSWTSMHGDEFVTIKSRLEV